MRRLVLALAVTLPACAFSGWGVDVTVRPPVVTEPTPSPEPTPAPSATPSPTPETATPTLSPAPVQTATPTPAVTPTASVPPTPTPGTCVPKPGTEPVTLIYRGACPRFMEPLDFAGEGNVPASGACAVKAGEENRRTAWRLGYGLGRQGMLLEQFGAVWLQHDPGRGCTDAYGRHFPDCKTLYEHPEGETAPYTWGGYVVPTFCGTEPTPTPTGGPTPTPLPTTGESCVAADGSGCTLVCTVAFLGWNDRPGLPPGVEVGGEARLDITCRRATQPGDSRGQPVDRFGPEWCEPNNDPVTWIVSAPGGVGQREFNDGYGLALSNLQPGDYKVSVAPNKGALDRKGQPIQWCSWGHGSSTKTAIEFEVR